MDGGQTRMNLHRFTGPRASPFTGLRPVRIGGPVAAHAVVSVPRPLNVRVEPRSLPVRTPSAGP